MAAREEKAALFPAAATSESSLETDDARRADQVFRARDDELSQKEVSPLGPLRRRPSTSPLPPGVFVCSFPRACSLLHPHTPERREVSEEWGGIHVSSDRGVPSSLSLSLIRTLNYGCFSPRLLLVDPLRKKSELLSLWSGLRLHGAHIRGRHHLRCGPGKAH